MSDANTENLSVRDYAAYKLIKPVTDTIGMVPIAGPVVLDAVNAPCKIIDVLGGSLGGSCTALQATLGELNAPAFPKTPPPAGQSK